MMSQLEYASPPPKKPPSPLPAIIAVALGLLACLLMVAQIPFIRPLILRGFGKRGFAWIVVLLPILLGLIALPAAIVGWIRRPGGRREILAILLPAIYWIGFLWLLLAGAFS